MIMDTVRWLGHSSFLIKSAQDDTTIYIDPYQIDSDIPANYIFLTHTHYDHFSPDDLHKILTNYTTIFAPYDAKSKLAEMGFNGNVIIVEPDSKYQHDNILVETVPAYNMYKGFHPKENNWVGYIIELDGKRYYHAGDTDLIEEIKLLKKIDVAMIPCSGTYVMEAEEAAEWANIVKPKFMIPMHYGSIVGSDTDAEKVKKLYHGVTKIMKKL